MASVSVSADLPAAPEKTWEALSDLSRWEEWLTIHQSWKSELPTEVALGATFTEVVSVMGMANKIEWTVTEVDAPNLVKIAGTGMAGVTVEFTLKVEPEGAGSTATIDASFKGAMIVGPIGKAVAKNAAADLEASLAKFAELVG
ncbi:type II toxin-antitoxin system Rv0910 family toxin [Rhodococcus maanshanensis]|uniref:Polyketide cyclase / dehydrase and lipid transport n=1 Tax=Rhodococcus maanshanensis TaxID=183556 RepID=A0A1H7TFH6_9NOCA|nr:SRPBCC family protein [Rhodococcus maanshanensis]SEL83295.1 Polyketide cyclase / dehydrase and lipid transport [Rhodococcus maanshanensis]